MDVQTLLQHPIMQALVSGLLAGVAGDLVAFRAWKSWQDAAEYNWSTASFRAVQGAFVGLLGYFGLAAATAMVS